MSVLARGDSSYLSAGLSTHYTKSRAIHPVLLTLLRVRRLSVWKTGLWVSQAGKKHYTKPVYYVSKPLALPEKRRGEKKRGEKPSSASMPYD